MVNMAIPYRGPDGMSLQLQAEIRARFGAREQSKGFVSGYPEAARRGETGGHFPDVHGITHAYDIGVDIELDGKGLRTQDALWLAHHLRALGAAGKHPFSRQGYLIHDMSETTTPRPLITGAFNGWKWEPYKGASPHSDHIHVTTAGDQQWGTAPRLAPAEYNSRASWGIADSPPASGSGGAMRPVPEMYPVTQTYRQNSTQYNLGTYHGAIDYGVPVGTPVLAPEDGIIRHAGFAWDLPGGPNDWAARDYQIKPARGDLRTGGGIMVRLDNMIGSRWWSAHLNRTDLNSGDRVRKGQIIGYSGNTGSSTGPHLHLALLPPQPNWNNGAWGGIDPAPFIRERYAPLTHTTWQGAPTSGVGATTTKKEWSDMATEKQIEDAAYRGALRAAQRELTYKRPKLGERAGGSVSIQDEILTLADNFAEIRGNFRAVIAAVSPSTLEPLIRSNLAPDANIDAAELAHHLAPALLRHILTADNRQEA